MNERQKNVKNENLIIIKHPKRFSPYKQWFKIVLKDFIGNRKNSIGKKIWAYKKGFYSFRIQQFDLDKNNCSKFISDLDYKKLYSINNKYNKWIDDKLTLKYVLSPFDHFMPKYFFYISANGKLVHRLMDCPLLYSCDTEGILDLLRSEGILAYKKVSGSHSKGFFKLAYKNGIYFSNGSALSEGQIRELLIPSDDYIVTEYVGMHKEIERLFPDAVNAIRIMIINENGYSPFIGTSYLRVEVKKTNGSYIDGKGPLACILDLDSGTYMNGMRSDKKHVIEIHQHHPDTGADLKGAIPHWNFIKKNVLKVSEHISQLEYMGFDIAVTEDGFKILEINSHQDLFRSDLFSEEVKSYLSRALVKRGIKSRNGF